jgi:hypothetical protein
VVSRVVYVASFCQVDPPALAHKVVEGSAGEAENEEQTITSSTVFNHGWMPNLTA